MHRFPLLAAFPWVVALFPALAAAEKPNVLIIVSDDQGYIDAGFQGGKEAVTPHLDRLAASGVRCTSGYASHPFCSPTRAGLLAGRYQARFGHEDNPLYDPLDAQQGLPLTEKLLPEFMKEGGYRTGWTGKWHLGASPKHSPWNRGFDECWGFIGGGHMFRNWKPDEHQYTLPLTRDGKELPDVPEHLTTAIGEEAAAFVKRNAERPWFLYLPFNAPHTPHQPTPEAEAKFSHIAEPARRRCLAQISLMDDAIGRVMSTLDETGQTKRTLVFFFGDNGGPSQPGLGADNGPLRKGKGFLYEGGIRVPFVVSWPGTLPAGTTYDKPVISLDAFATSLAVAGVSPPADRKYDGVNLIPHLTGAVKSPPHDRLFWRKHSNGGSALRAGNWKLVRADGKTELFDLATDLSESKDLATDHPETLAALVTALDAWEKEHPPLAFRGGSFKNEDWGPGGANEKTRLEAKAGKQR